VRKALTPFVDLSAQPLPAAIAAVVPPLRTLATAGGAETLNVELHHPFDDVADHLAEQIGIAPPFRAGRQLQCWAWSLWRSPV